MPLTSALHSAKLRSTKGGTYGRRLPRHHLRHALHRIPPHLPALASPRLVGHLPSARDRSSANLGHDPRHRRRGPRTLVHRQLRIPRQRNARALRSAAPPRHPRPLPLRPQPHVPRHHPRPCRSRALLRLAVSLRIRRHLPLRRVALRPRIRGTQTPPHLRPRVRSLLPQRQPMVAASPHLTHPSNLPTAAQTQSHHPPPPSQNTAFPPRHTPSAKHASAAAVCSSTASSPSAHRPSRTHPHHCRTAPARPLSTSHPPPRIPRPASARATQSPASPHRTR